MPLLSDPLPLDPLPSVPLLERPEVPPLPGSDALSPPLRPVLPDRSVAEPEEPRLPRVPADPESLPEPLPIVSELLGSDVLPAAKPNEGNASATAAASTVNLRVIMMLSYGCVRDTSGNSE